jgi:hypothetical protein
MPTSLPHGIEKWRQSRVIILIDQLSLLIDSKSNFPTFSTNHHHHWHQWREYMPVYSIAPVEGRNIVLGNNPRDNSKLPDLNTKFSR